MRRLFQYGRLPRADLHPIPIRLSLAIPMFKSVRMAMAILFLARGPTTRHIANAIRSTCGASEATQTWPKTTADARSTSITDCAEPPDLQSHAIQERVDALPREEL